MSENKKFTFHECSQSTIEKTAIWENFLRESSGEFAKCKICNKVLKTAGKSTSGLHKHLASMHSNIKVKKGPSLDVEPPAKRINLGNSTSSGSITKYLSFRDNSLEAVLARMTADDGLPFSIFITSIELRKSLVARGFDVPKSAVTIRDKVMKFGYSIRQKCKSELQKIKADGKRFSLTFDEWTSNNNRRYLNINAHIKNQFWNLGLTRVRGSLPAESCIKLIEERLELFGIDLHKDIVCITTDGAPVMQKVGKLLVCLQQLCLAHGVHLAVLDVLYKQHKSASMKTVEDGANSESDDEENGEGFQIFTEEVELELADSLYPLIRKVRAVVKLFRKSPTKNDVLQKHIKEQFNREIQLMIDIKTRWNSLFFMLQRFNQVKNCILKSLIDVGSAVSFNDNESNLISNLVETLEPVKLACESFCRRDATLLSADTTISFMLGNLGNSDLAKRMKDSLSRRINERRTEVSGLLQYLHKCNQQQVCAVFNLKPLQNSECMSKTTIISMIAALVKHYDNTSSSESEAEIEVAEEPTSTRSLREKLQQAIDDENNAKIRSKTLTPKDLSGVLKKELVNFEINGKRGPNLERCYIDLTTIPPTSVESERVFSGCGKIVTKIRSSLNDESLDLMCFLRSYFKSEKQE